MNHLVIYHDRCVDGAAAAWVMDRWFEMYAEAGDGMEFHPGVYGEAPPDVSGKVVYLVDFSYKRDVVEEMLKTAKAVIILDHHKTAIAELHPLLDEGRIQGVLDQEHSGCMVAWRWAFGNAEPPRLLRHIEDRDLWRFNLPHTRELHAWLTSHPLEILDVLIEEIEMEGDTNALIQGCALLRAHDKAVRELVDLTRREMEIAGYRVPVANVPSGMASDAGHIMAEGNPFAAIYYDTPTARRFGLRSTDPGVDVSEIARLFGGGGHRNAAGFEVPRDHELARC